VGYLARLLAEPTDALIRELRRAYADEWFGHYNYALVAHLVTGTSAESVAALLRRKSEQALRRADRLAVRLIELGSQPVLKLTDLLEHATDKPFKLPEDFGDSRDLLKAVLDAERTSVRTHTRIYEMTRDRDPVTAALVLDLLREALEGEHELERLLGEAFPEMDGT
jgi:ferritin-like protein